MCNFLSILLIMLVFSLTTTITRKSSSSSASSSSSSLFDVLNNNKKSFIKFWMIVVASVCINTILPMCNNNNNHNKNSNDHHQFRFATFAEAAVINATISQYLTGLSTSHSPRRIVMQLTVVLSSGAGTPTVTVNVPSSTLTDAAAIYPLVQTIWAVSGSTWTPATLTFVGTYKWVVRKASASMQAAANAIGSFNLGVVCSGTNIKISSTSSSVWFEDQQIKVVSTVAKNYNGATNNCHTPGYYLCTSIKTHED